MRELAQATIVRSVEVATSAQFPVEVPFTTVAKGLILATVSARGRATITPCS
jgi:hypothetical protein